MVIIDHNYCKHKAVLPLRLNEVLSHLINVNIEIGNCWFNKKKKDKLYKHYMRVNNLFVSRLKAHLNCIAFTDPVRVFGKGDTYVVTYIKLKGE